MKELQYRRDVPNRGAQAIPIASPETSAFNMALKQHDIFSKLTVVVNSWKLGSLILILLNDSFEEGSVNCRFCLKSLFFF